MVYIRPVITPGVTRANRDFWENVLDGVDEAAASGGGGGVALIKNATTGMYAIGAGSSLTKNATTGMYPIGA